MLAGIDTIDRHERQHLRRHHHQVMASKSTTHAAADDDEHEVDRRTRFPPVAMVPTNTPQQPRQLQQQQQTVAAEKLMMTRTAAAVTVSNDATAASRTTAARHHPTITASQRVIYELPARRMKLYRQQAAAAASKNNEDVLQTHHSMADISSDKPTIFNREPVPFNTAQFKFSSMMKSIPVNRGDWSHYSPLLSRCRAVVVQADRHNLQLAGVHQHAADRRYLRELRRSKYSTFGSMDSDSDYCHYSRRLRLPEMSERQRSIELMNVPMNTTIEPDLVCDDQQTTSESNQPTAEPQED